MIVAISVAVAMIALIPFLLIKSALGVFRWNGLIAHLSGGAIAGILGFAFLLSHGATAVPAVIAIFAGWGAVPGLIYWMVRWLGDSIVKGRGA